MTRNEQKIDLVTERRLPSDAKVVLIDGEDVERDSPHGLLFHQRTQRESFRRLRFVSLFQTTSRIAATAFELHLDLVSAAAPHLGISSHS